jgi:hypothetical protein
MCLYVWLLRTHKSKTTTVQLIYEGRCLCSFVLLLGCMNVGLDLQGLRMVGCPLSMVKCTQAASEMSNVSATQRPCGHCHAWH